MHLPVQFHLTWNGISKVLVFSVKDLHVSSFRLYRLYSHSHLISLSSMIADGTPIKIPEDRHDMETETSSTKCNGNTNWKC